jgi:hypothetical protein
MPLGLQWRINAEEERQAASSIGEDQHQGGYADNQPPVDYQYSRGKR